MTLASAETPSAIRDVDTHRATRRQGRIRVLELVATGTTGGAQEHVATLLGGLDRDRYDLRVVSFTDGSSVRRWRETGVPVDIVRASDDLSLVTAVAERLVAWRTQVLHAHMYRAEVVGARAALRLLELGHSRPYVIGHVHSSRRRSAADRAVLAALAPTIDRLVGVSRSIRTATEAERQPRHPVELIYNGVDIGRYDEALTQPSLPNEYGFPASAPIVGCVARLEPEKGHATLLAAWPQVLEQIPDARLLIVGEGSCCEPLRQQAEALGLAGRPCRGDSCVGKLHARPDARVLFTGRRDDIPAITASLDVAVLPSYREAQGLVILEAMALGRPVVATRVGGIPEMVEHGVTGLLVPPHDAAGLASAIIRQLTDRRVALAMARSGRERVHELFRAERMVGAIAALYEEGLDAWLRRSQPATMAGSVD